MDVILKKLGNSVGLYINRNLATVLENKNIEQAADFVRKNLKGIKIYVAK